MDSGFDRLFRSVYPDMQRYFARILGPDQADDAVAATLTAVLEKWASAPARLDQQRAWAFGFAHNKLREAERERRRQAHLVSVAATQSGSGFLPAPDDDIAALDRARRLLARLPQGERDAVNLTMLAGLTAREAGQVLGCSTSAVTSRVTRAQPPPVRSSDRSPCPSSRLARSSSRRGSVLSPEPAPPARPPAGPRAGPPSPRHRP
ncbi:MAG: RNA polymerase sigma factor [Cellulomonadaceae bacterium]|jgi:RNA polymerase sigma-70 factor (ECF subfamily)|nr:RNA polymerase sigma factor [Cellulomonadaceae bacterium]